MKLYAYEYKNTLINGKEVSNVVMSTMPPDKIGINPVYKPIGMLELTELERENS